MAKTFICMPCGTEFSSEAAFEEHKKSGHMTQGTSVAPPDATMPTPEFMETVKRLEDNEKKMASPGVELPALPEPKPITLSYLYSGDCETCKVGVQTLELDVEIELAKNKSTKHFVIAFCPTCKKQLQNREVKKL